MNSQPLRPPHATSPIHSPEAERLLIQVLEAVDAVSPSLQHQLPPSSHHEALLRLLTYCYARGLFSSEDIERALIEDPTLRFLAGGQRHASGSLRSFRRRHRDAVQRCLARTLEAVDQEVSGALGSLGLPSDRYASHALERWGGSARTSRYQAEAADRLRQAICNDTALLDE